MLESGFEHIRNNDYYNPKLGIILEDLHELNVYTKEGVLYFIDTVFYISPESPKKFKCGGDVDNNDNTEKFDNSEESRNFTQKPTKDELQNIISGNEGTSKESKRTIIESAILYISTGIRTAKEKQPTSLSNNEIKDLEARLSFEFAKKNNVWIEDFYVLGEPLGGGGNENTLYYDEKQTLIYKSNNLFNYDFSILNYLKYITHHNSLFKQNPYNFIGFNGIYKGDSVPYVEPVVSQKYVAGAVNSTEKEIEMYMESMGFEKINDYSFRNEFFLVSDLRPRNVLKDKEGKLHVIDNIIKRNNLKGGTLEKLVGENPKVEDTGFTWNEEEFLYSETKYDKKDISDIIFETGFKKTYLGNTGVVTAKNVYRIVLDKAYKKRWLLLSELVGEDNKILLDYGAVGEYDFDNLGIQLSHRGKGAGRAFVKELIKRKQIKPSIGYSHAGYNTIVSALKEIENTKFERGGDISVTETSEFKKWFGKSEVVDENNKPLIVYRGQTGNREDFGNEFKLGLNLLKKPIKNDFGFFFTSNYEMAKSYSGDGYMQGFITSAYLKIEGLLDIRNLGDKVLYGKELVEFMEFEGVSFESFPELKQQIIDYEASEGYRYDTWDYFDHFPKLREVIQHNGFQGLVFTDNSHNPSVDSYVVFESTQIKLADGSNTKFDSSHSDIRYKNGGEIDNNQWNKWKEKNTNKKGIAELELSDGTSVEINFVDLKIIISKRKYKTGLEYVTNKENYSTGKLEGINEDYKKFDDRAKELVFGNKKFDLSSDKLSLVEVMKDGGVISASSRFRPYETIVFDKPLIGLNGAKLVSYTWAYEWTMTPSREGELVGKRISDWTQAEQSADTGKNIVHQFTVELTDGKKETVSSESVLVLLGYTQREKLKTFPSLVNALKTLAKQRMQLSIMEAQEKEYVELQQKYNSAPKPDIIEIDEPVNFSGVQDDWKEGRHKVFAMGDIWARQSNRQGTTYQSFIAIPNPTKDTVHSLTSDWVSKQVKDNGGKYPQGIYDLRSRVKRQERKVQLLTGGQQGLLEKGGNIGSKPNLATEFNEMKKGGETFAFFDKGYDVDKAYKMINSRQYMYDIKVIAPYEIKHRMFNKEYSDSLNPDFTGAQGLMIKLPNGNDLLIDGNHRMNKAYSKRLKEMKVYYISNPKTIKKFTVNY